LNTKSFIFLIISLFYAKNHLGQSIISMPHIRENDRSLL